MAADEDKGQPSLAVTGTKKSGQGRPLTRTQGQPDLAASVIFCG